MADPLVVERASCRRPRNLLRVMWSYQCSIASSSMGHLVVRGLALPTFIVAHLSKSTCLRSQRADHSTNPSLQRICPPLGGRGRLRGMVVPETLRCSSRLDQFVAQIDRCGGAFLVERLLAAGLRGVCRQWPSNNCWKGHFLSAGESSRLFAQGEASWREPRQCLLLVSVFTSSP